MIAKVATAQDDITGDGTTSNVLIIGELLKQADLFISEVQIDIHVVSGVDFGYFCARVPALNFRAGPGYPRLANYTTNKSKKWNQHVK